MRPDLQMRWFNLTTAVRLWLYRHHLRRCPNCHGARMVHHFGTGPTATLTRCWSCTGENTYLADTSIPCASLSGDHPPDVHPQPELRAV
jgi:hypothetical protein